MFRFSALAGTYQVVKWGNDKYTIEFQVIKGDKTEHKQVLPAVYDSIEPGLSGMYSKARFNKGETFYGRMYETFILYQNNKAGYFIAFSGDKPECAVVLDCEYDNVSPGAGDLCYVMKNGKYGVYAPAYEQWLLPAEYDGIAPTFTHSPDDPNFDYFNDVLIVEQNKHKGAFHTSTKKWMLNIEYDDIPANEEFFFPIKNKQQGFFYGKWNYSKNAEESYKQNYFWVIQPGVYNGLTAQGRYPLFILTDSLGKKGILKMDKENKTVTSFIAADYDNITQSSLSYNTLFKVQKNGSTGLLNQNGWLYKPIANAITKDAIINDWAVFVQYEKGAGFNIVTALPQENKLLHIADKDEYGTIDINNDILVAHNNKVTAWQLFLSDTLFMNKGKIFTRAEPLFTNAEKYWAAQNINNVVFYTKNSLVQWVQKGNSTEPIKNIMANADSVSERYYRYQLEGSPVFLAKIKGRYGAISAAGVTVVPFTHTTYSERNDDELLFRSVKGKWRLLNLPSLQDKKATTLDTAYKALFAFTVNGRRFADFDSIAVIRKKNLFKTDAVWYDVKDNLGTQTNMFAAGDVADKFTVLGAQYTIIEKALGFGLKKNDKEVLPAVFNKISYNGAFTLQTTRGDELQLANEVFNTAFNPLKFVAVNNNCKCRECKGKGGFSKQVQRTIPGKTTYTTREVTEYTTGGESVWDAASRTYKWVKTAKPVKRYITETHTSEPQTVTETVTTPCTACSGKGKVTKKVECTRDGTGYTTKELD